MNSFTWMNSSDNGGNALSRAYHREASLRKILWEKSWILDENCDDKLKNYPKSKTQINSFHLLIPARELTSTKMLQSYNSL